jgi:hypothetical protein
VTAQEPVTATRTAVLLFLVLGVFPLLPMLITRGGWGWPEAWTCVLVSVVGFMLSRILAARRHPDLLAERASFSEHEDAKPRDRCWRRGSPPAASPSWSLPVQMCASAGTR